MQSSSSRRIAFVAVGALAVVLFFVASWLREPASAALEPAPRPSHGSTDVASARAAGAERERGANELANGAPAPSSARASLDVAGIELGGIEVDVVESDGRPVPGVDVLYVDSDAVDVRHASGSFPSGVRFAEVVDRSGRRFRTDPSGRTSVLRPREKAFVGAAHAGSWATATIEVDTDRATLTLEPDVALDVRVSGANASDLAVVVFTRNDEGVQERTRGRTGADGLVRFEHVGWIARMARKHSLQMVVAAEVPSSTPVVAEFSPHAWPGAPIELVLPETGEVQVEFFHPDRALTAAEIAFLARGDSECTIAFSRDELGRQVLRRREQPKDSPASKFVAFWHETPAIAGSTRALTSASTTFATVGLGLELVVKPSLVGWSTQDATFHGPTRAGERVVVRVPLHGELPKLSGRLVDGAGGPLARREFVATFTMTSQLRHTATERGTTDADGRFVGLGNVPWAATGHFDLTIAPRDDRSSAGWRRVFELGPRTADLGDLVIDVPRLLASGRVVDERGAPVRAALVTCEAVDPSNSNAKWTSWKVLPNGAVRTDVDGRFEIRSWTEDTTVRVGASRRGHLDASVQSITPPRTDLELVLERGGAIEGRIVSRALDAQRVHVQLRHEAFARVFRIEWMRDGAFRCDGLGAGTYELDLRLPHQRLGTHVVKGIVVRARETTQIAPIDVDLVLHEMRFDVRDPSGRPIDRVRFAAKVPAFEDVFDVRLDRLASGTYVLHAFEPKLDLVRIAAPGHATTTLADVDGDREVVLQPGPRVRLELASGVPPIASPWSLVAVVQSDGAESTTAAFDASGVAHAQLERPGAWRVGIAVKHAGEQGRRGTDGIGWTIEVRESAEEQVFASPPITELFLEDLRRVIR